MAATPKLKAIVMNFIVWVCSYECLLQMVVSMDYRKNDSRIMIMRRLRLKRLRGRIGPEQ